MGTEEYRRQRDLSGTPEPPAAVPARHGSRFVAHRHEARRLHYDLRLEAGGVLACFAVPRGFSYDAVDKRLAVRTEDHPLGYESFEGVIPAGSCGAATMRIWDSGVYELLRATDIAQALGRGEPKLVLKGRRAGRPSWSPRPASSLSRIPSGCSSLRSQKEGCSRRSMAQT